jgi:hypothetical protein
LQLLLFVREFHELHELWPHFAASDGFAVYKKAAKQLSIRVARLCRLLARIREIRGQNLKDGVSRFNSDILFFQIRHSYG